MTLNQAQIKIKYGITTWPEYELNFWKIPKCASTYMMWNLLGRKKKKNIIDYHDLANVTYITPNEAIENGYDNLAITRHPYKRVVSLYNDFFRKRTPEMVNLRPMYFEEFLKKLLIHTDELARTNVHFRAQTYFICDENDNIRVETLIDIEKLGDASYMKQVLPSFELKKIHTTGKGFELNKREKDMVYERYARDFEILGYDRNE